ncbi:cyclase family protein [Actinokineospora iranica]|uniref:Putative cyclase n=1 Tax=Actinokineospora iranica TaxID=1271860 RepID=A0A1G6WK31_9PSEU|nr:cyclase family protein [Actinokineospora iranica]SDD66242.1 Putative cyclase [Actinokineospora iranica]
MRPDLVESYLSRRAALGLAGRAAVAGGVAATGGALAPGIAAADSTTTNTPADTMADDTTADGAADDSPFDYSDLAAWAPSRYGPDDQRGSLNEITPETTARALRLVRDAREVRTYNLGEVMWNGFPGFVTTPPRLYEQRLTIGGYTSPRFEAEGGIVQFREPLGSNRLSLHEERFAAVASPGHTRQYSTTYQLGVQLDGLNHVGCGEYFYNGHRGPEIDELYGTSKLGAEHTGPIVTRGVLLDVLGVKLATGDDSALGPPAANGAPVLASDYRITLRDIHDAMDFGGIGRFEPGDAILFRTGWNQLLHRVDRQPDPADIDRWMGSGGLPGIYLREARYLARHRPALIGSDTWALEVLGNPVNDDGLVFPVHQDLLMRFGIRIAESVVLDGPARDRLHTFVYLVTPQLAEGATCGNTPPAALGAPRR